MTKEKVNRMCLKKLLGRSVGRWRFVTPMKWRVTNMNLLSIIELSVNMPVYVPRRSFMGSFNKIDSLDEFHLNGRLLSGRGFNT